MKIPISGTPESRKQAEEKHTGVKAHKSNLAKQKIRKNTKIVLLEQKEGTLPHVRDTLVLFYLQWVSLCTLLQFYFYS